ncbi:alpha/beta hydrolase [Cellulomonas uda]|uniref:Alpha/beta hydrolase n=1 Tax=Cellulomonas uda TaxID=1714 RepID=A0A4Y3KEY9_CELUD|nr:alpha/beta hydrolase [Cellulomonas uda]NII66089.1 alpha-beta hydrolase superfamily lysophospholipase [Cellulomonas uda]GEA82532.1 alpha/beta hydrolase [Cellulomonas uda]
MSDGAAWGDEQPDVLGGAWVARTLELPPDDESAREGVDPVATLVHRPPRHRRAVLYLHGFVDYFFHPHVADALDAAGWDLYGLDLHDYGRSIREGRRPNHTRELAGYAREIDAVVALLRADHDRVALLGHSTGGLVAALWADARPGRVDAVVLNSPWLDLRKPWFDRVVLTRTLRVLGRVTPELVVGHIQPHYGRALHAGSGGEWTYELAWKPHEGFPVRASFIRTIRAGHARVARGLDIREPVLVLTSDATGPDDRVHDGLLTTDSVLDVAQIAARAPGLGRAVRLVTIPGGAHDLALSPARAREEYLGTVVEFLDAHAPA